MILENFWVIAADYRSSSDIFGLFLEFRTNFVKYDIVQLLLSFTEKRTRPPLPRYN